MKHWIQLLFRRNKEYLSIQSVLPAPPRFFGSDEHLQWLGGEGAGSWFLIQSLSSHRLFIKRFSVEGALECEGIFIVESHFTFDPSFCRVTYPSNCKVVTLLDHTDTIVCKRLV